MYGAKTQGVKKPKSWTESSDHKWDRTHGVKEGSAKDNKLDMQRGIKDAGVEAALAKLRGGK